MRVTVGEVLDVAVDIRRSSPHFGKWASVRLSAENNRQLWIPPGFAHGFVVLSDYAEFLYKTTDYYTPSAERCIRWDDRISTSTGSSMAPRRCPPRTRAVKP